MRKNYTNGSNTVIKGYESDMYVAVKDLVIGEKKLFVKGIFHHESRYGTSYALVISEETTENCFNLNIPKWLGQSLEEDLKAEIERSSSTAEAVERYFDGYYIKSVVPVSTKNGNSYDLEFDK